MGMLQFLRSMDKPITEWTSQEVSSKKAKIQQEIMANLGTTTEPQSVQSLTYQAYMNFRDSDYKYDEQQNFAVEAFNELIKDGKVRVVFVKLQHPGAGLCPLVPLPYIQLVK